MTADTWMATRRWLAQPLLQFLLLGLIILGVDRLFGTAQPADGAQQRIVVTDARQAALADAFRAEQGRAPRPEELRALLDRWIDEQVLYREAVALGLDRRDAIVQRQLTQKMRFLIEDATLLPEPTMADLQVWLEQHPERFGQGPTVSFEQVFLSRGRHGGGLSAEADKTARRLHADPGAFVGLGDPFLVGQVISGADEKQLRRDFGNGFGQALAGLPVGEWSDPIESGFGLHLVRITGRSAFEPARLSEVADRVRVDYRHAQREVRNRESLAALRARYRIDYEDSAG